jgi:hypothetical protein
MFTHECESLAFLFHQIAPGARDRRHHSGGLASEMCQGWSIRVRVECSFVAVQQHFCGVVSRQQDVKPQSPRLISEATSSVRH